MNLSGISDAQESTSVVVQTKGADTTGKLYCMIVHVLACKRSVTAPQRKTFVYDHVSLTCKIYTNLYNVNWRIMAGYWLSSRNFFSGLLH